MLYRQLETYLKNGQWREADEETLKIMLKIVDCEKVGWLDPESINDFPCEDLQNINQLWLHYSNGKFGFSLQKEIYKELGGTEEYNEEVYRNFGNRVGWRKDNNWLNYNELIFNKNAPKAHLPHLWPYAKSQILQEEEREGIETVNYYGKFQRRLLICNI